LTDGFVIQTAEPHLVPGLDKVNEELRTFEVIAFPANGTGYHLRERYSLDAFFRAANMYGATDKASVVFGENALMLHCIMAEAAENQSTRQQEFLDLDIDRLLAAGIVDNQTVEKLRKTTEQVGNRANDPV
jgi:hypothetical protein